MILERSSATPSRGAVSKGGATPERVDWRRLRPDFEAAGWGGGTGWDADWETTGSVVKDDDGGYQSDGYLKFSSGVGTAKRVTSLSNFHEPRLKFYADAGSFEAGDTVQCLVSTAQTPGPGDWDTLQTWENGDDAGEYLPVDIDIVSYGNATYFWVAFETDLAVSSSTIAQDDFESGGWSGGTGWNGAWNHSST